MGNSGALSPMLDIGKIWDCTQAFDVSTISTNATARALLQFQAFLEVPHTAPFNLHDRFSLDDNPLETS